jgi:molybdate transport system ATP-binding protein
MLALGTLDRYETVVAVALGEKGDGARILSRMTQKSLAELELAEGQSVYAQVKYVSLGSGRGEPEE